MPGVLAAEEAAVVELLSGRFAGDDITDAGADADDDASVDAAASDDIEDEEEEEEDEEEEEEGGRNPEAASDSMVDALGTGSAENKEAWALTALDDDDDEDDEELRMMRSLAAAPQSLSAS